MIALSHTAGPGLDADCISAAESAARTCPIVARDPAMVAVLRRVEQVAPSSLPVLISGECGTGKALVAAYLHGCLGHAPGALTTVDCTSVTELCLDLALARTNNEPLDVGALDRKAGEATSFTLLLREIGEMDAQIQAKLVRMLREQESGRAPGDGPRAGVRILATTTESIQQLVQSGRFRADLLFRLNVLDIKLPALRDRPADIPLLASHFVHKFAAQSAVPALSITDPAIEVLLRHTWPGNVRELENVIRRAVLTETGGAISAATLAIDTIEPQRDPRAWCPSPPDSSACTIAAVEKEMILDRLRNCKGNRAQTAATLGISIRTLRNKLNDYERSGTRIPKPVVVVVN